MSSQSQGLASTAPAAGSAAPIIGAMGNKMKLEIPPTAISNGRSNRRNKSITIMSDNAGGAIDVNANASTVAANAPQEGSSKDDGSVPHVVRVTFLGVAGLLANPLHQDSTVADSSDNASQSPGNADAPSSHQHPITVSSSAASSIPASSQHPSLLFPLPLNLRVVASVSRSRTARGIPSGMSKCLAPSSSSSNAGSSKSSVGGSTSGSMGSLVGPNAGSFSPMANSSAASGTSGTKSTSSSNSKNRIHIEEVSITRESSGKDDTNKNYKHTNVPPSQLMHSRTGSTHRSSSGLRGDAKFRPEEGVEVIRPHSPSNPGTEGTKASLEGEAQYEQPGRFVAVWDENSKQPPKATATNAVGTKKKTSFVNPTNSLAFEAELRPSSSLVNKGLPEDRASTPVASTTFAPKSFCVTLGLVPDFDHASVEADAGQTRVLDGIGEQQVPGPQSASPPEFAIPVGFADLVINGDETLDGRRRQIDLPLSSIANFMGAFGGNDEIMARGNYPFPLIELTAEGLAGATDANNNNERKKDVEKAAVDTVVAPGKTKKKSIVKRMFSRKQQPASPPPATASAPESSHADPSRVYSGTPKSVFQLGRPPNAKERALFLHRYGVDPSGDAVVRIGLEVFPRGSELEKVFRQKNKLRKKAQAMAAASARAGGSSRMGNRDRSNGRFSPSSASIGSRTLDTADSRSLMDEEALDSDCDDSNFSQSFFTLDSDTSRTTWDESTMYTDALSSDNTIGDDSISYISGVTGYEKSKPGRKQSSTGNFLTNLLNCSGPTTCGVDDEAEADTMDQISNMAPFANIDAVSSAIAEMSMPGSEEETPKVISAATSISPTAKSIKSLASMGTEMRANNVIHLANSNAGVKLTLDTASPTTGVETASINIGSGSMPSLNISIPVQDRSLTISNEKSTLAIIKQRVGSHGGAPDELVRESSSRLQYVDEGHEFTLEDHQSASM